MQGILAGGVTSLDVEVQAILVEWLAYVRSNLDQVDEIFRRWTEQPHLAKLYGSKKIRDIKDWLQKNEVPVTLSWQPQNAQFPGISVHLAQEAEQVEDAAMADQATTIETPVPQPLVLSQFTPRNVNTTTDLTHTALITLPVGMSTAPLYPGHVMVDAKGEEYTVIPPITSSTFTVDLSPSGTLAINPAQLYVKAGPGLALSSQRASAIRLLGHVDVGFHAYSDYEPCLWLYFIIQWANLRFKPELETRGIQLQTFSGSELNLEAKYQPEWTYTRWLRFSAQIQTEWTEDPTTMVSPPTFVVATTDPQGDSLQTK